MFIYFIFIHYLFIDFIFTSVFSEVNFVELVKSSEAAKKFKKCYENASLTFQFFHVFAKDVENTRYGLSHIV